MMVNFALEYAIRRVKIHQDGLKLNGTRLFLVYVDNVNRMGGSVHAVKKNTDALLLSAKEIGIEVNADKTKYMVMSRDQNAGQGHDTKTDNTSFERAEEFKYLGTTLTSQNSMQE